MKKNVVQARKLKVAGAGLDADQKSWVRVRPELPMGKNVQAWARYGTGKAGMSQAWT